MAIEQASPEMDRIVSQGRDIEELGRGYSIAEGPLWDSNEGCLLFSDIRNNRTMRWTAQDGMSVSRESTNEANGLTWDPQGRLVICEGGARRMTRLESDGTITVVADNFEGTRFNHPNDVVVKSDGTIYFTDPGAPDPELDMDFCGVYRVSADLSALTLLVRDFVLPNGLCFSPDESILYVNDSTGVSRREDNMFLSVGHIRVFDVGPDGALTNDRVFSELRADRSGIPDGMKVDVEGNLYSTGPGGVWVFDPSGNHLGTILTGSEQTTNCAWGGDDWKTFFITTFDGLYSIQLNIAGVPVPTS